MKYKRNTISLFLILLLILAIILPVSTGCWGSPTFDLIIENQTEDILTIYVNDYRVGNVEPGAYITREDAPWDTGEYRVVAKNIRGETIFDKILTWPQMQRIKSKVYKVVIPPLQK